MRGKNKTPKRKIKPDIKYNNVQVSKFINYIMKRGKKSVAQTVLYDCFDIMAEKTKQDPLEVFNNAIKNVSPQLEIRSKRVGGANYQVPVPVKGDRKYALACRWILAAANDKKGRMASKLAEELVAASNNEGTAIKKKEDVQRMAEANRAFAHFAR